MNEFLIEYYNTTTFIVEILAAVTGLICYKAYKTTAAKYFIGFLIYLSICDFIGSYVNHINGGFFSFLKETVFERNFWWTTLYWKIGAIVFVAFYYYKILANQRFKTFIKFSGYSFFVFSVVYLLLHWEAYFTQFFPVISVLGAIVVFLCTVFYFIETLQSDKILTFYKSLNFYISFGIFIWWLIITPLVFYDIYNTHYDKNFLFLKWEIYLFANIFMYLTFTFALLWCKPQNV